MCECLGLGYERGRELGRRDEEGASLSDGANTPLADAEADQNAAIRFDSASFGSFLTLCVVDSEECYKCIFLCFFLVAFSGQ